MYMCVFIYIKYDYLINIISKIQNNVRYIKNNLF